MSPWAEELWLGRMPPQPSRTVAQPEPVPPEQLYLDFPEYGGMLHFNSEGIGACPVCGWRGVPTIVDGIISSHCPACNSHDSLPVEPERLRYRNLPCPCGSEMKAKRCPCELYTV